LLFNILIKTIDNPHILWYNIIVIIFVPSPWGSPHGEPHTQLAL